MAPPSGQKPVKARASLDYKGKANKEAEIPPFRKTSQLVHKLRTESLDDIDFLSHTILQNLQDVACKGRNVVSMFFIHYMFVC